MQNHFLKLFAIKENNMFLVATLVGWAERLQPRTYFFDH